MTRFNASVVLLGLMSALRCSADLTEFDVDFDEVLNQTGPSVTSLDGYFFDSRGEMASAGNFNGGTLTYPGAGSPQSYAVNPSLATELNFQTGFFPSLSALALAFPFGVYTINATNSGNPSLNRSDSVTYSANFYTATTPLLNAATYGGLQGLQTSNPFNIVFPSFTPALGTDAAFTFFTITNANTGAVVFSQNFLSPTTAGVLLPANTLSPGALYDYDLDYSDLIEATGSTAPTNQLFDVRTEGSFTTASASPVPEPHVTAFVALGVLCVAGFLQRSKLLSSLP